MCGQTVGVYLRPANGMSKCLSAATQCGGWGVQSSPAQKDLGWVFVKNENSWVKTDIFPKLFNSSALGNSDTLGETLLSSMGRHSLGEKEGGASTWRD